MNLSLDEIQEMWQRDSVIDPDNLHDESLKIPQLHSKYLLYTIPLLFFVKRQEKHITELDWNAITTTPERQQQRSMPKNHFRIR